MSDNTPVRLDRLEAALISLHEIDTLRLSKEQERRAEFTAICTIVEEMAERIGLSREDFFRHLEARTSWWHDRYLKEAAMIDKAVAGQIDRRQIIEVSTDESYPRLFSQPSE